MVGTHTEKGVGITLASCPGLRPEREGRAASVEVSAKVPDEQFSDRHRVNGQWPVSQRMGEGGEPDWLLHKKVW